MVYKRRRYSGKKRSYGKKKTYRKKFSRGGTMRYKKSIRQSVKYFKRVQVLSTITTIGADAKVGQMFRFDMLSNYSEYSALFDQFMICGIKWTIDFDTTVNTVTTTNPDPATPSIQYQTRPILHTVIDHDDSNTPTTIDQMMQYSTYRKVRPGYSYSRYFVPAVAVMMYSGATDTGYGPKFKTWVDMDHADVEHNGLKWILEMGDNTFVKYRTYFTYYFKVKGAK